MHQAPQFTYIQLDSCDIDIKPTQYSVNEADTDTMT